MCVIKIRKKQKMPYKFNFFVNDSKVFSCDLKCIKCEAKTPRGTQCQRTTCIGVPYCFQHLKLNKQLAIKKHAKYGRGLFAVKNYNMSTIAGNVVFKRGDFIMEYEGEIINKNELDRRYGDRTGVYVATIDSDTHVDSACYRGVMSLANHSDTNANAALFVVENAAGKSVISVEAIKNIRDGDEILLDYGDEYILTENYNTRPYSSKRR